MIASEKSQDLSEAILTLLAPCEGIVKFRLALLVMSPSFFNRFVLMRAQMKKKMVALLVA